MSIFKTPAVDRAVTLREYTQIAAIMMEGHAPEDLDCLRQLHPEWNRKFARLGALTVPGVADSESAQAGFLRVLLSRHNLDLSGWHNHLSELVSAGKIRGRGLRALLERPETAGDAFAQGVQESILQLGEQATPYHQHLAGMAATLRFKSVSYDLKQVEERWSLLLGIVKTPEPLHKWTDLMEMAVRTMASHGFSRQNPGGSWARRYAGDLSAMRQDYAAIHPKADSHVLDMARQCEQALLRQSRHPRAGRSGEAYPQASL